MNDVDVAVALARARIALGVAAIAAPRLASRAMGGARAAQGVTPVFARMLGARDVALGLGAVIARDRGKPVRGWLEAAALSDGVDCAASLLGRGDMPPAAASVTAAAGATSALANLWLAQRLDPPPRAEHGHPEAIATGHSA